MGKNQVFKNKTIFESGYIKKNSENLNKMTPWTPFI